MPPDLHRSAITSAITSANKQRKLTNYNYHYNFISSKIHIYIHTTYYRFFSSDWLRNCWIWSVKDSTTTFIRNLTYIRFGIILTEFYINFIRQEHQIDVLNVSFKTWDSQVSAYTWYPLSFFLYSPFKATVDVTLSDTSHRGLKDPFLNLTFHDLNGGLLEITS